MCKIRIYRILCVQITLLDLRKTSQVPGSSSSDSEVVLSDGEVAIATSRVEKQLMNATGELGAAGILRKSSLLLSYT